MDLVAGRGGDPVTARELALGVALGLSALSVAGIAGALAAWARWPESPGIAVLIGAAGLITGAWALTGWACYFVAGEKAGTR